MTLETVVLAGGCFWGMQDLVRNLPGVKNTRAGYAGGSLQNPTYKDVCTGKTGHAEAVFIEFDADQLSLRKLLEFFFQIHDPTTVDRQGNDRGSQYRSAIFARNDDQAQTAKALIKELDDAGIWPSKIVTQIEPGAEFFPAEESHQDYLVKFPEGYTCHFVRPDWKIG